MTAAYDEARDWRADALCVQVDPELFFPAAEHGAVFEAQVAAAKELAEKGDYVGAIAQLRQVAETDPGNLDARRELARFLAFSGEVIEASKVLGQLPPVAQSDPASNAVRSVIHFASLATEEAARNDAERASAARSLLGGSVESAVETLLARMQSDRTFATRAGREDLLQAFAISRGSVANDTSQQRLNSRTLQQALPLFCFFRVPNWCSRPGQGHPKSALIPCLCNPTMDPSREGHTQADSTVI